MSRDFANKWVSKSFLQMSGCPEIDGRLGGWRKGLTIIAHSRNRDSVSSHIYYVLLQDRLSPRDLRPIPAGEGRRDLANGRFRNIPTMDMEEPGGLCRNA